MTRPGRIARGLLIALGVYGALFLLLLMIGLSGDGNPVTRAMLSMIAGLVLLWCVLGGGLMWALRGAIRPRVQALRLDWRLRFVLFCIVLALIEEAITTLMTNLGPAFGVPLGAAYITASADYLDVVLFHSVIVFVPMLITWSLLLSRWDFHPSEVMLLFGLTGVLAETISFGPQNLLGAGMWVFVYGLMVVLPAVTLPEDRGARPPRWWAFPLALVLPVLAAVPVALIVSAIHPISIHF